MPASRTLAAAVLVLLAAAPALAQSEQEIIGTYRMTVQPQPGSLCPPGEADFEVTRVGGQLIEVSLDHTKTIADWDPARRAFAGTIPFPDPEHPIHLNGGFSRGPDRVNLAVTVSFPPERPCEALLSGSIPADALDAGAPAGSTDGAAAAPPAPPLGPPAPSPVGPPIFGVAPNGQPPIYSTAPTPAPAGGLANAKLLVMAAAALLLVGVVLGFLRGKARRAAPATAPVPPPPAPPPDPEPPAPKPKAPRKPKPKAKPTEAEDELGEG